MINYVTFDFETANKFSSSACALTVVEVKNHKIVKVHSWLINPEHENIWKFTFLHGISKDIVKDAPVFPEIYQEVFDLLDGKVAFAHNVQFNKKVLNELCTHFGLVVPNNQFNDTVSMARAKFPALQDYTLNTVSKFIKHDMSRHNLNSDAIAVHHIVEAKGQYRSEYFNDEELQKLSNMMIY